MTKVSNLLVLTTNAIIPSYRNDWTIIGKFSELTNEQCEEFVELGSYYGTYWNYETNDNHKSNQLRSAKESLKSRLKSEGIDINEDDFIIKLYD